MPEKVNVAFELALEGTLRFQTERCEKDLGRARRARLLCHSTWPDRVPAGKEAVAFLRQPAVQGQVVLRQVVEREFRLAVTGYGDTSFETPIYFDPEVVLEKSGGVLDAGIDRQRRSHEGRCDRGA